MFLKNSTKTSSIIHRILYFSLTIILLSQCKILSTKHENFDGDSTFKDSFTGYKPDGTDTWCYKPDYTKLNCPATPDKTIQDFIHQCEDGGFVTYQCDCTNYLCSGFLGSAAPSQT